jgi:hypothetical protein
VKSGAVDREDRADSFAKVPWQGPRGGWREVQLSNRWATKSLESWEVGLRGLIGIDTMSFHRSRAS